MTEEAPELKDTFDGYLMFDFANFHGLMAQSFDNDELDLPFEEKPAKLKRIDVPGPYLAAPPMRLEREGDYSDGVLFSGNPDEDEIPEINLDDDQFSHFNYSSSELNLMGLDLEPDEDAYDVQDRGRNLRASKKMTRSLNQEPDTKIAMINIQNLDMLKNNNKCNLDEFYRFLKELEEQNAKGLKNNDDPVKEQQLIALVTIRKTFEDVQAKLQKKNKQTHFQSFQSKLIILQQTLEHFNNLVGYMVDNGSSRQKVQRDQVVINSKKDYTLTMSVAFFKAMEIINQLKYLSYHKQITDISKRSYGRQVGILKSRIRFIRFIHKLKRMPGVTWFESSLLQNPKNSYTTKQFPSKLSGSQMFGGVTFDLDNKKKETQKTVNDYENKVLRADEIQTYLMRESELRNICSYFNQFTLNLVKQRLRKQKYIFREYQEFKNPNDEFLINQPIQYVEKFSMEQIDENGSECEI